MWSLEEREINPLTLCEPYQEESRRAAQRELDLSNSPPSHLSIFHVDRRTAKLTQLFATALAIHPLNAIMPCTYPFHLLHLDLYHERKGSLAHRSSS